MRTNTPAKKMNHELSVGLEVVSTAGNVVYARLMMEAALTELTSRFEYRPNALSFSCTFFLKSSVTRSLLRSLTCASLTSIPIVKDTLDAVLSPLPLSTTPAMFLLPVGHSALS